MTINRLTLSIITLATLLLIPLAAFAKPQVDIKIKAEKEVVVVKNGQKSKKMIAVKKTAPGEIIQYTLSYKNSGTEAATNAVVSDPIPEGTVYVPGSALEVGELGFSVDGGKTFNKPALLSYEVKTSQGKAEKRVASPDQYTHIRWVIDKIPAGASGSLHFKVKVK